MGRLITVLAFATLVFATLAQAHDYIAGDITVDHPWSKATPPGAPVAGGYLTIVNAGGQADRLLRIESDRAAKVEVHQSVVEDGLARMRPLTDGLEVGPGQTLQFQPSGMHVMFLRPVKGFVEGDKVPARLIFERAGPIAVEFRVQGMGDAVPAADAHAGHGYPQ